VILRPSGKICPIAGIAVILGGVVPDTRRIEALEAAAATV
jgi:hypothetical protein